MNVAQYLGHGLTWTMSTGLFLVGGWFVDRWLGTMPLFLIIGAFVGAGAGFYSLYHHVVVEPRRAAEARARELRGATGRPEEESPNGGGGSGAGHE